MAGVVSKGRDREMAAPAAIPFTRRLSVDGRPLVEVGQWVDAETALLAMDTFPGRVLRNQVARELRVNPAATEDTVLRPTGQMVKEGDILARSSLFWNHRIARSQYEGSVAGVSPSLGVVYMREHIPTQIAETVRINIIEELQADKNLFYSYVKVREGDSVEKGQLIATAQSGHSYRNIFSPVFGTVANVAPLLGGLSIIPDRVSSVVTAHIPGRVTAIRRGREVDLLGYGVVFSGLVGVGGESHGTILAAANDAAPWRAGPADQKLAGRVLVAGHVDETSLREAAERGAAGFIAGRAHERDVCGFIGTELGVIATGDEDVPMVLVLTEGFGCGPINPRLYRMLASLEGRLASLSGTTHIRAGVIRPRIVVSEDPPAGFTAAHATVGVQGAETHIGLVETPTELAAGLRARILRGRYAGQSGTIVELPARVQAVATGAQVLVARVRLDVLAQTAGDRGAEVVTVPQANLKLEGGGNGRA